MLIKSAEQLEDYEGRVVNIRVHLGSHLGNSRQMLYVGALCFADSCEELLQGGRILRGLSGFPEHLGLEEGLFTIYNNNLQDNLPLDALRRLNLGGADNLVALKIWEDYQRKRR